jgi:hypothetical protein
VFSDTKHHLCVSIFFSFSPNALKAMAVATVVAVRPARGGRAAAMVLVMVMAMVVAAMVARWRGEAGGGEDDVRGSP